MDRSRKCRNAMTRSNDNDAPGAVLFYRGTSHINGCRVPASRNPNHEVHRLHRRPFAGGGGPGVRPDAKQGLVEGHRLLPNLPAKLQGRRRRRRRGLER